MKGRKATGGAASGDPPSGSKLYNADLNSKPNKRNNAPKITNAAEEKKGGGRAKRKRGGGVKHREQMGMLKHASHVGAVSGSKGGHKGKKSRGGSNFNPLSSAASGTAPSGHKTDC